MYVHTYQNSLNGKLSVVSFNGLICKIVLIVRFLIIYFSLPVVRKLIVCIKCNMLICFVIFSDSQLSIINSLVHLEGSQIIFTVSRLVPTEILTGTGDYRFYLH
jgi:hypothetical protein